MKVIFIPFITFVILLFILMYLYKNISLFQVFYILLLIILLAGCKKPEENKIPLADYIFRGTVKSDKTGESLQGIIVTIKEFGNKSIITAENGSWYFEYSDVALTYDWNFSLTDADSIANGSFEKKDTTIKINPGFLQDDDGSLHEGRVEAEIVFTLKNR